MKIIIAGAGEVGFHLAKLLSYESQEITLIDLNKDSLVYAHTHLDIKVIKGDATSISVLKDARILNSDLFISVTSSETSNITACVLAKQLGAKRTIARISNTEFINHKDEVGFTKFGIDELISPESLAAAEIELLLSQSVFNDTYEFEEGALTMLGLSLSKDAKIQFTELKYFGYSKMLTSSDFRTTDTLTVVRTQWDSSLSDSLVSTRVDSLKLWLKSELDVENLEMIGK